MNVQRNGPAGLFEMATHADQIVPLALVVNSRSEQTLLHMLADGLHVRGFGTCALASCMTRTCELCGEPIVLLDASLTKGISIGKGELDLS